MTTKAAQILHVGGSRFLAKAVLDRGQSWTPNLTIPSEKVYETGNAQTVADVRDSPELSFDVETLDVSTEFEALVLGLDPTAITAGQQLDLLGAKPLDIISPWKRSLTQFDIVSGVAFPFLQLESATYRFGVGQNSTQAFTFRGDSVYYIPGTPYFQAFPASGTGPYSFTNTAIETNQEGDLLFAYSVTLCLADGTYTRLFLGDDYTNTSSGFTLTTAAPAGSTLHVVYGSATPDTYDQTVNASAAVKPAAVRGKNIDVYVSDGAATPTMIRWKGLQSAEINWRLTLDPTRELGNPNVVSHDYDVPELSGSLAMRPESIAYLTARYAQMTGVDPAKTINALSSVPLDIQIRISHPTTGAVLKTFIVDDARFTPAPPPVQANTRLEVPFAWTSDTGSLKVVNGAPA